jgi:hypothetical protein
MQIRLRILIFGILALAPLQETDAKADGLLGDLKGLGPPPAAAEATTTPRIEPPVEYYPPPPWVKPLSEEDPRCGQLTEQQRQQTLGCNNQR